MRIRDRLLTVSSPQVGVDHPAGDRAGTDDADLDDQVVVVTRFHTRQHRHLGTTLDLKDPHRVTLADHLECRFVLGWDGRQGERFSAVVLDEIERAMNDVQRPKTQQVDLEELQVLEVVLVPLDHRAVRHGGVLDRHELVNRRVAEQKTSRVDREVTREVLDLGGQTEQELVQSVVGIEAGLDERLGCRRLVVR